MIHIPRQLYQKIQFNKSLHSSPQLAIQILVFLVVLIAIAPSPLGQATPQPNSKGRRQQLTQHLFPGESIFRMI